MHETQVARALGFGPDEVLEERGVFPAMQPEDLATVSSLGEDPGRDEVLLTEEWLSDSELETRFSDDPRLTAALPSGGRVKRLDVDPRVIVFEEIERPTNSLGQVRMLRDGTWIMDTRSDPAALVIPNSRYQLVVWGEGGSVRLFALRS
jgi:hypothetical protein